MQNGDYTKELLLHTNFLGLLHWGAIQDEKLVYEMASKIASDAKRMGVNWDFAPVVDVNTNPSNPIIGNRSFGSDVQNVIRKGLAYSNGLQDNGVLAAIKHFPRAWRYRQRLPHGSSGCKT